jgi:DNA-binding winged helix-turn-helix (wHTH) protein
MAMQYIFGDYRLDLHCDELHGPGGVVQLDRQVFAVLAYLVQHHDRLVQRQELFEHLWPDRVVSDAALERCIAVARRAVEDNGRDQQVIQTVHGRGYRFVASVTEYSDAPLAASPTTPPSPSLPGASTPPLADLAALHEALLHVEGLLADVRDRHAIALVLRQAQSL